MMRRSTLNYWLLALAVFVIDRITKLWAVTYCADRMVVNQYCSFELMFNRGVSCGLLHSSDERQFILVTLVVVSLIALLVWYTYDRLLFRTFILGETLVLAGAVSNLVDRIFYKGVVDFIALSAWGYDFHVFNVADVCIVLGVAIMLVEGFRE